MIRERIYIVVALAVVFILAFGVNYQYTAVYKSGIMYVGPTQNNSTYSVKLASTHNYSINSVNLAPTHNYSLNSVKLSPTYNFSTYSINNNADSAKLKVKATSYFTDLHDYMPRAQYKLTWDEDVFRDKVKQCSNDCKFVFLPARRGRMGNNMFQVASLIGTARDLDVIPVIKPTFALRAYFNMPNMMKLDVENAKACKEPGYGVYARCRDQGMEGHNVSLIGFRQSWKYFNKVSDDVRQIFRFKKTFMNAAKELIKSIAKPDHKIIGIHVRRGDITPAKRRSRGNAVVEGGFFRNAIGYFKRVYLSVTFIVMSNDMRWCKKYLTGHDIVYSPFKNAGNDMALMTLCDHMILTYGSFGYWGAWLSGKPAVYFWENPREKSKGARGRSRTDYYPPNWIPMPNKLSSKPSHIPPGLLSR